MSIGKYLVLGGLALAVGSEAYAADKAKAAAGEAEGFKEKLGQYCNISDSRERVQVSRSNEDLKNNIESFKSAIPFKLQTRKYPDDLAECAKTYPRLSEECKGVFEKYKGFECFTKFYQNTGDEETDRLDRIMDWGQSLNAVLEVSSDAMMTPFFSHANLNILYPDRVTTELDRFRLIDMPYLKETADRVYREMMAKLSDPESAAGVDGVSEMTKELARSIISNNCGKELDGVNILTGNIKTDGVLGYYGKVKDGGDTFILDFEVLKSFGKMFVTPLALYGSHVFEKTTPKVSNNRAVSRIILAHAFSDAFAYWAIGQVKEDFAPLAQDMLYLFGGGVTDAKYTPDYVLKSDNVFLDIKDPEKRDDLMRVQNALGGELFRMVAAEHYNSPLKMLEIIHSAAGDGKKRGKLLSALAQRVAILKEKRDVIKEYDSIGSKPQCLVVKGYLDEFFGEERETPSWQNR